MIKQIELELTTACNAACPQCSRNFYGGPTWPSLPNVSLNLTWLQEKLPISFLENLEVIRFCGTYGDPCVHPDLTDIVMWLKSVTNAKIVINTNGGMRSNKWWKNLASVLDDTDIVIFGIDGLKDTNHLYRRRVDFEKVVEHVKAFNSQGGKSVWQFLVFEHNQHQLDEAKQLSTELGFSDFVVKYTTRFVDKTHNLVSHVPVIDEKKIYFIKLPSKKNFVNSGYDQHETNKQHYQDTPIKCIAKRLEMLYIGADGYVFPCGFLADRLYGYEAEMHKDHKRIQHLFELAGGAHLANLNYTGINDIVDGAWFHTIEKSWVNNTRLERCAHQCGETNKLTTTMYSYMRGEDI